ncbi:hypothetical protein P7C70_g2791, partial [Phenoliferia sp. Uapishka_3]
MQSKRTKSASLSSTTSPWDASPSNTRPKTLSKSPSLADLKEGFRPKWLHKLKKSSKQDFDFGCAGDSGDHDELPEEVEEDEMVDVPGDLISPSPRTAPPCYTPSFAARQAAASHNEDLTLVLPTAEELKAAARRQAEEAAALDALDFYLGSGPSTPVSPSDSSQLAYLAPEDDSNEAFMARSRSSSTTSSSNGLSSRPRTNESLPSYHSSPVTTTSRRPTLTGTASSPYPLPLDAKVQNAPRTYSFI